MDYYNQAMIVKAKNGQHFLANCPFLELISKALEMPMSKSFLRNKEVLNCPECLTKKTCNAYRIFRNLLPLKFAII